MLCPFGKHTTSNKIITICKMQNTTETKGSLITWFTIKRYNSLAQTFQTAYLKAHIITQ